MSRKYEATGPETEFEPGTRRRVLRNLLGIRSVGNMNQAESDALLAATNQLIDETTDSQRFTASTSATFTSDGWVKSIHGRARIAV